MLGAHIPDNAQLILDRTIKPDHNRIVVVDLNGERLVRRLIKSPRSWVLQADGMGTQPLLITKEMDLQIFGVVTKIIIET
jgi:DNA polymerase V